MEISKMITMSTCHITEETDRYLSNKEGDSYGLTVYDKDEFGFFIYMPSYTKDDVNFLKRLPKDLALIFMFARQNMIDIVCLDCDGDVVDSLPQYDW